MLKQKFTESKISSFELSKLLNERIEFSEFLVIDEEEKNLGILKKEDALKIAKDKELDLFCITPYSKPPVCKIINFSKHFYKLKKGKNNDKKSKKKTSSLKEAKFSFRIGENDIQTKVQKIVKWLENDDFVKIVFTMWGREQKHKELALEKCNRIIKKVQDKSPQFQLKEEIKLVGNSYIFTFFRNKKASNKNDQK